MHGGFDLSEDYTIPSDNRELQLAAAPVAFVEYYTIPSDNRELQLYRCVTVHQRIIPYQVITGNYSEIPFYPVFVLLYHTK